MKAKKVTVLLLAALTALSMVACGGKKSDSDNANNQEIPAGLLAPNQETGNTTKSDETLVVNFGSMPADLWHPATKGGNSSNQEQIVNAAFLDRLVDLDENTGEVIPMLATSWTWLDGTHIQLTLREGVKFTDGHELTADDVVYTANIWMENCGLDENGEGGNDTGKYFVGVTKDDDMTVTFEINCEAPEFIKMLTWGNFGIVSESEINALGGLEAAKMNPVMGTGKYRFKEWKDGEYILLERNDDYWDANYVGYFKEIKFVAINDTGSAAASVQSGDIDVTWQMPVAQAASYADDEKVRTYVYSNGEVEHLWFNMGEGHATSDIRVRQAIDLALDYDQIAAVGTAGLGSKCYSYTTVNAPYYSADYTDEELAVNVEKAKELLAEAGYADGLTITVPTLPDLLDVYQIMQNNLKEVGITLEIAQMDMGGFVPAMLFEKSYDIVAVGDATGFRTPQLPQFVSGGMVFGGPNAVLDKEVAVLNNLMVAPDDAAAKSILQEYNALVKEELPCVNLYEAYQASLVNASVKGFAIRERGYVDVTTLYK